MEAIEAILTRRSVRRGFAPAPVSDAVLDSIVKCGLAAPSSKDEQPWHLHVVRSAEIRKAVAEAMSQDPRVESYVPLDATSGQPEAGLASSVRDSANALETSAVAIFIEALGRFGTRTTIAAAHDSDIKELLVGYGFELVGIGAAVENILIAAHACGLGAVFIGDVVIAEARVADLLRLTGDLIGVVCLGRIESSSPPTRRTLGDRVTVHPDA